MGESSSAATLWLRGFGSTRTYAVIWFLLLIYAFAVTTYGNVAVKAGQAPAWTPYGVTTDFTMRTIDEVFSTEARRQGIAPGDDVIAVDGMAVDGAGHQTMRRALARHPDDAVTLTLRRPDGTIKQSRLHWRQANVSAGDGLRGRVWERSSPLATLVGDAQTVALVLGAILLFRRRRDPVAALISLSLLVLTTYGIAEYGFYELGYFTLQRLGSVAGFSLFLLGLMSFPAGRFEPRWTAYVALLVPAWALFASVFTRLSIVTSFSFALLLAIALIGIWVRYRRFLSDAERQQVRWFMFGTAMSALCSLLQASFLAAAWTSTAQNAEAILVATRGFSLLAVLAFVSGLVVSLLKFRLYDADAVIGRSLTFGTMTVGLLAIFTASEKMIEAFGEEYFGDRLGALAGGLSAAVAAIMISPLHHYIAHWAESRFQKNLLKLRNHLPLLVADLRETSPVANIAKVVLGEVTSAVRATRAAIVGEGGTIAFHGSDERAIEGWRVAWTAPAQDGISDDRSDVLFPVRIPLDAPGHARVGWLVLGPRPDGSFYGRDERDALSNIADPVARALAVAQQRAAERSRIDGALNDLQKRLTALEVKAASGKRNTLA